MIVNGKNLLDAAPISCMLNYKGHAHCTSYGLVEAGYDIRIAERIEYKNNWVMTIDSEGIRKGRPGKFCLASSIETFQMPKDLVATVKDKSTWARKGLSVFNTVIEPGWNGILTLELVFHGNEPINIPAGSGIAQVLFNRLECEGDYGNGKYQNAPGLQEAKFWT
jgi:dCTP deaminase